MASRRSTAIGGALLVTIVIVGLIGGFFGYRFLERRRAGPADNALRRTTPSALQIAGPAPAGPFTLVGEQPSPDGSVSVQLDPPAGAQAVRVDTDPGFEAAGWRPLDTATAAPATITVDLQDTGYQTIFGQFMMSDATPGPIFVTAAVVDPTFRAATSSEVANVHTPSFVRPFSATELLIRVEAGRLERGAIEPYDLDNPLDGDRISRDRRRLVVNRDGSVHGMQVSRRTDAIRRPDRLIGRPLDGGAVLDGNWLVSSDEDPAYGDGIEVSDVRHLARPAGGGVDDELDQVREVIHDFVVTLPTPLQAGAGYRIAGSELAPLDLTYDPETNLSPAVRVNQVGYAPGDELKVAYLSGWFDGIGRSALDASDQPSFQVVDVATGDVAARGSGRLRPADNEMGQGDLTGSPVIELDFSQLTRPGRYQLCVTDIGCSYEFDIEADVWHRLSSTVARAMYHQRSGTELGPPYTSVVRPRPNHPDDGATVLQSEYSLLRAQTETGNTDFELLAELRTEDLVDTAWGGHFDAGDWDRRINHLWYARNAAQLVMTFPATFDGRELNIPESGDPVPDLLDEALWTVDLYRRMQRPDGAIRGGIEASEHPPPDTPSWADDLATFAYRADRFSSYLYAGAAAEMSAALAPYDGERADELLASAVAAMEWAEGETRRVASQAGAGPDQPEPGQPDRQADEDRIVAEQRNVAAAGLLLATGDADWHELFIRTATFLDDNDPFMSCHAHGRCDAAWLYLQADESVTDPAIRGELRERFIGSANATITAAEGTGYGWTTENPGVPLVWGLGSGGAPHTSGLLKAYLLTGEPAYRAAAVRSASVALGANPMNRVLLTGLGTEPVRNPQINDVKFGGLPVWPGTPVYGHHALNSIGDESWVVDDILEPAGATPDPTDLPYLWQWYDVGSVAQFNEFTVHQSHAEALLSFGVLAATSS